MLDTQVRRAVVIETDQRTVPAPDGAVVQTQMKQVGGRFFTQLRHQHRVILKVLEEQLRQGLPQIMLPETDAPRRTTFRPRRADGNRLFEQRNARLVPQLMAEEIRRVGARRDHGRGQNDRGVVEPRILSRRHLQMNLERGRRRLKHHVRMIGVQRLPARDVELDGRTLAQSQYLLIEGAIPRSVGNIIKRQGPLANRRQDAGHDRVRTQ